LLAAAASSSPAGNNAAKNNSVRRDSTLENGRNGRNTLFGEDRTDSAISPMGNHRASYVAAVPFSASSTSHLAQQRRRKSSCRSSTSAAAAAEQHSLLAADEDDRRSVVAPSASFACERGEAHELVSLHGARGYHSPATTVGGAVNPFQVSDDEGYLNSWDDSKRSKRLQGGDRGDSLPPAPRPPQPMGASANQMTVGRHFNSEKYERIDRMAMWLFPIIFFLFNVFYWSYYLLLNRLLPELW